MPHHLIEMARHLADINYIRRYGIPTIPLPDLERIPRLMPWPPEPFVQLQQKVHMQELLLAELIGNFVWGEPTGQTSLLSSLQDPKIRLESAENLHRQLTDSLKSLETEMSSLRKRAGAKSNKKSAKTTG